GRRSELAQVASEDIRAQPVQRDQHLVPRADDLREERRSPVLVGPRPPVLPALARRLDDRSPTPEEPPDPDVPPHKPAAVPAGGSLVQHLAKVLALLLGSLGELGQLPPSGQAQSPRAKSSFRPGTRSVGVFALANELRAALRASVRLHRSQLIR